eukprot:1196354-Prorocentrum_minimum.AAC.3
MHLLARLILTLLITFGQAITTTPEVWRLRSGVELPLSLASEDNNSNSTTIAFDSGNPPAEYQTGGIVWAGQQLGVRFRPSWASGEKEARLVFLEFTLCTERVTEKGSRLRLSLCGVSGGKPSSDCTEEEFTLPTVHQVKCKWELLHPFSVENNSLYWLIVTGGSWTPQHSFSWLDGDLIVDDNATISAYKTPREDWVYDATNQTLPSLSISVEFGDSGSVITK